MSETTKIELAPEAERLLRDMAAMPAELPARIARAMDDQNKLTVAHIMQAYLSFPKGSPPVDIGCRVQSNRLRGGVWASAATTTGGSQVTSSIGDNVKYAAIHEFGGIIEVGESNRTLRFKTELIVRARKARYNKRGKAISEEIQELRGLAKQKTNKNLWVFAKGDDKHVETIGVTIGAHTITMPERRPFRRGIEDRIPNYEKAIAGAVVKCLRGTSS